MLSQIVVNWFDTGRYPSVPHDDLFNREPSDERYRSRVLQAAAKVLSAALAGLACDDGPADTAAGSTPRPVPAGPASSINGAEARHRRSPPPSPAPSPRSL